MSVLEQRLKAFYAAEMMDRAGRMLSLERTTRVDAFVQGLRAVRAQLVLEVGCGAGRDGVILRQSGCAYVGVDFSPVAVRTCRDRKLNAVVASATEVPFADDSFDAAWSMSTLMHLPGDGFSKAIRELGRVVRCGGVVEIGVWGHFRNREWTSPDGRYFIHRSDDQVQSDVKALGEVVAFDTWSWSPDGGHYQWVRVITR
ncbi:hypothetical protein GCM10023153_10390 [Ornithinibacter aureus]|uniref:Methyltransferase type 11 domain-containing protein n=1 Tax=Ornithinibacter aureus TaxID=622664 RepID=A0ABP8JJU1_9MICO|nr:class I SAM-dependent methyltransferase [Ornithinibacter aureus]KAF0834969.1 methyltransferase family protein [Ornithinibacter aureus]